MQRARVLFFHRYTCTRRLRRDFMAVTVIIKNNNNNMNNTGIDVTLSNKRLLDGLDAFPKIIGK